MMVQDDKKFDAEGRDISKPLRIIPQDIGNNSIGSFEYGNIVKQKPSLLLHSCCGPCSTAVIESLVRSYKITVYFCNSNIDDREEYEKRLQAQKDFITSYNASPNCVDPVEIISAKYEPALFLKKIHGHEDDPEGGERCKICMEYRLAQTADFASLNGFEYFTSTLSVSPHKNYELIASIGKDLMLRYGVYFVCDNFRKKDGYKRSIELSKLYGLYRQNYCGCSFSKREAMDRAGR